MRARDHSTSIWSTDEVQYDTDDCYRVSHCSCAYDTVAKGDFPTTTN